MFSVALFAVLAVVESNPVEEPCKVKSRVTADDKYCDKYWECDGGQPVEYDCPNGLVFAGKHRGVTEGCDYPWRSNYCEYPKTQISEFLFVYFVLERKFRSLSENIILSD